METQHSAIVVDNQVQTEVLVKDLLSGVFPHFSNLKEQDVAQFSKAQIAFFIEEEERHDKKILTKDLSQSLKSMSSGERKRALLNHLLKQKPQTLLAVNPFDSLDMAKQEQLKIKLQKLGQSLSIIQITNRIPDILPFAQDFFRYTENTLIHYPDLISLKSTVYPKENTLNKKVPGPLIKIPLELQNLVTFAKVSVSFNEKPVLSKISWTIKKGEFWQLVGPNGSGKSTLLNLITGDSHKGYGQNLTVFGHKKGSGESVWDLKEMIGYFSPAMVDRFRGYHTLEHMLISGLHDSVGLYIQPSENEKQKALEWLRLLGMEEKKDSYFHELSLGAKRLLMTARALIKHPPLLILDEPTVGLDDSSTSLFVNLINRYALQSTSAIVYVSHRKEENLNPDQVFELLPKEGGSVGKIHYI